MRDTTLGDSGLAVPVLFFGCGNFWGIGSQPELYGKGDDRDTAFELMDAALAAGLRMFDTANAYGGGVSEQWIGEWLASRGARDDVLLTTKVAAPVGPGPDERGLSRRHIRAQIDASLARLGTDHVELYLAHTPDDSTPIEETIGAFDELVREGKIAHYGLSNFDRPRLASALAAVAELGAVGPVNLQSGYNLLDRTESATFDLCAASGIGFTAYSPLAGGLLARGYTADQPPPPDSRLALRPSAFANLELAKVFPALARLTAFAAERDQPLATLALAWALTDPGLTAVLVAPRTPAQLRTACDALDVDLTEADRAELVDIVS